MTVKMIFAIGSNGEFGNANKLPWGSIPEDLKHFKELTKGSAVIMGYNTWKSLPKKLPERINGVITSRPWKDLQKDEEQPDVCGRVDSVLPFCESFKHKVEDVFIIGGKGIVEESLDRCIPEEIHLTQIKGHFTADTYIEFPEHFEENYHKVSSKDSGNVIFEIYKRV